MQRGVADAGWMQHCLVWLRACKSPQTPQMYPFNTLHALPLLCPVQGAIIANPNCSTIIALMAVTPLHRVATVKRMVVSTYQAASGGSNY